MENNRMLTEEQVAELGTVLWLRRCGLSMKKVRKYAAWTVSDLC